MNDRVVLAIVNSPILRLAEEAARTLVTSFMGLFVGRPDRGRPGGERTGQLVRLCPSSM